MLYPDKLYQEEFETMTCSQCGGHWSKLDWNDKAYLGILFGCPCLSLVFQVFYDFNGYGETTCRIVRTRIKFAEDKYRYYK